MLATGQSTVTDNASLAQLRTTLLSVNVVAGIPFPKALVFSSLYRECELVNTAKDPERSVMRDQ